MSGEEMDERTAGRSDCVRARLDRRLSDE